MVYMIGSHPQVSKNSASDMPPMQHSRNCGMRKCVVAGSRSGTPPSRAVSIRCLAVMFIAASSTQDLLGRQAVGRLDPDGYPAALNGRHVGRHGARIGDHFLDLFDVQRLAQGPLTKLRVVHQQHHPRRLFGNDLLDANGGDRRLERALVRQKALGREEGDVDEEPPGGLLRRGADQASGGRIELASQCENGVRILLRSAPTPCTTRPSGSPRSLPATSWPTAGPERGRSCCRPGKWFDAAESLVCRAGDLLLLCPVNRQPLLDGRFEQMFGGVRRLNAAEGLDDATLPDQLIDVAADGHLGHGQPSCQVLVQAGPDRIKVLDDRILAF